MNGRPARTMTRVSRKNPKLLSSAPLTSRAKNSIDVIEGDKIPATDDSPVQPRIDTYTPHMEEARDGYN